MINEKMFMKPETRSSSLLWYHRVLDLKNPSGDCLNIE